MTEMLISNMNLVFSSTTGYYLQMVAAAFAGLAGTIILLLIKKPKAKKGKKDNKRGKKGCRGCWISVLPLVVLLGSAGCAAWRFVELDSAIPITQWNDTLFLIRIVGLAAAGAAAVLVLIAGCTCCCGNVMKWGARFFVLAYLGLGIADAVLESELTSMVV